MRMYAHLSLKFFLNTHDNFQYKPQLGIKHILSILRKKRFVHLGSNTVVVCGPLALLPLAPWCGMSGCVVRPCVPH